MSIPSNINSWLIKTLLSNEKSDLINLVTGYEAAITTLIKHAQLTVNDLDKEVLFNEIYLLVKVARENLLDTQLDKTDLRLNLLDDFEISLRRSLTFDRSSFKPLLVWKGEKEVLAEIFVHLKRTFNKKSEPLLINSYEDIALFLKTNFDVYRDTELTTILTTLKSLPRKIENQTGKVQIQL